MRTVTATAFALALAAGLAAPAFAATTTTPANSQNQPANPNASMSLREQVKDDLTKAGFTDVRVMPESFLVRAKDAKGNKVMMVINPDSFAEVTAISPKNDANANNNAANGASGNMANGAASPAAKTPTSPAK